MMRMLRSRWLWGAVGAAGIAWAYQAVQGNQQAKKIAAQRSRAMWRRAARTGRTTRPTAFNMASRAGRAMMDTTMRTVRAMNRV